MRKICAVASSVSLLPFPGMPYSCSPSVVLAGAGQLDRGERDPSAKRTERPATRRPDRLTASCNTLPGKRNDGGEHAALARRSTDYAD